MYRFVGLTVAMILGLSVVSAGVAQEPDNSRGDITNDPWELWADETETYDAACDAGFACDDAACDAGFGCDDMACDAMGCDSCQPRRDWGRLLRFKRSPLCDYRRRTPGMLGGFYSGRGFGFGGNATLDRLVVVADDLDSPLPLPAGDTTLSITEPGPVGIFSTTVGSVQELQTLLRNSSPIPTFNLEGTVADDATLTTLSTISDIQSQLAGTGQSYDIILLARPPGTYDAGVDGVFQTRNGIPGTTVYNNGSSGAFVQGGVDTLNGGEDLDAFYFYDYIVRLNTSLSEISSGGVGRMKIADNGVVLPEDRIFFRYGNLYNTGYGPGSPNLNRFVAGAERSFMDGLFSMELRAPFATDATTSFTASGDTISSGSTTRFGNLSTYLKLLLIDNERLAISGGLGLNLPTASDTHIRYADGQELLRARSRAVHLQPFVGMLYTPSRRAFAQAFLQYDIAANGNPVAINTGSGLVAAGKLTDTSVLLFDAAIGYWLYQNNRSRGLTGVIPTLEVHQSIATGSGDLVSAGPFQVGNFSQNGNATSLVAGTTFEFGTRTQLTTGFTTAIGSGANYDGAFQVQLTRLYGR